MQQGSGGEEPVTGPHRNRAESNALPVPVPTGGYSVAVPTSEQFAIIRMEAKEDGKLQELRRTVAAWQAVAEKCDLAFGEVIRLAVFRLEVERDLGAQLAQTVRPGPRSNLSPGMTNARSGLPAGVTRNQSTAYQRLASIPEDQFRAYIERSRDGRVLPSSIGARRCTTPKKPGVPRPRKSAKAQSSAPSANVVMTPAILDCVQRVLGDIDVCVGDAQVKCKLSVAASVLQPKCLRGTVFIADCMDPNNWIPKLTKLHSDAQLREAIVLLPAVTTETWFHFLFANDWACCFPSQAGVVLAHLGRHRAFAVAFREIGAVVHKCE